MVRSPAPQRRLLLAVTAFSIAAATACGSDDDADPGPIPSPSSTPAYVSGSRLRARLDDGGEGATAFRAWHDTELDIDCAFQPATDGSTRCIPRDLLGLAYYSDAGCTMPIVVADCGPPAKYVSVPAGDESCLLGGQALRVHEVGATISVSETFVLQGDGSAS